MKLEMITQTGVFGYLFIATCFIFIYLGIKYLNKNGIVKTITPIMVVGIGLFMFTTLATELLGKSMFDVALVFIKEVTPFMFPSLTALFYIVDSKGIDNLIAHKNEKAKVKE